MNEKQREKSIIRVSLVGILGNILLVAGKVIIGAIANSASIISDAINNFSDALSSLITIVGTKLSGKKPNKKHPFGYGRIEYLTATIVAALILFAGGSAIYESITSLIHGDKPTYDMWSFIILGIAIAVKVGLGLFFRFKGKKLSSGALKNSGTDALMDAILSVSTVVAALISHFTQVYLEGYVGILIGLFILRSGFIAMKESLSPILGDRIDDAYARQMKADFCAHPYVKGAYDLIIHDYGDGRKIGSVHIEVDDKLSAQEIYALEREMQLYAYDKHNVILTVGIYASNDSDPLAKEMKTKLLDFCREKKEEILQFHGFYFDKERELVSFDLVLSFDVKDEDKLIEEARGVLEKDYPKFRYVVNVDRDYAA